MTIHFFPLFHYAQKFEKSGVSCTRNLNMVVGINFSNLYYHLKLEKNTSNSKLSHFRPWDKDRYMSPDIVAVNNLLKEDKIWNAVKHHMESYHTSQVKRTRNI